MAKAFKCDRCGQFYDYNSKCLKRYYKIHDIKKQETVDLCPDCYEHFEKWLQNENEPKEEENEEQHFPLEHLIGSGELELRNYDFEEEDGGSSNS